MARALPVAAVVVPVEETSTFLHQLAAWERVDRVSVEAQFRDLMHLPMVREVEVPGVLVSVLSAAKARRVGLVVWESPQQ
jgi:hypothetical protein